MVDETISYRRTKKDFWRWPSRSLLPVPRLARREAEQTRTPDTAGNVRTAAGAMLIAFALFLVFESEGLRHFTRDLPGNAVTDMLVEGADNWHALMERLGPARLEPAIRETFDQVRKTRW
jgi:hypothetical protein